jgi:hypothetical protein
MFAKIEAYFDITTVTIAQTELSLDHPNQLFNTQSF